MRTQVHRNDWVIGVRQRTGGARVAPPHSGEQWAVATQLLADYFDWLAPLAGVESVPAVQPQARAELVDLASAFAPPGHRFLLATKDHLGVGIVGLKPGSVPETAELVRFYSRPAIRGAGVGTALLLAAIGEVRTLGYRQLVLDTAPSIMPEAVRLYERHGFAPTGEPHGLPIDDGARYRLILRP